MYICCEKLREIHEIFIVVSKINVPENEAKKQKLKKYLPYLNFEYNKKKMPLQHFFFIILKNVVLLFNNHFFKFVSQPY